MRKEQLLNLINLVINFHKVAGEDLLKQSPDYILEKWSKYIGKKPIKTSFVKNDKMLEWESRWGSSEEAETIIYFLSNVCYGPVTPSIIIEEFESCTGLSIEDINKELYRHFHELNKRFIDRWLNMEHVRRDLNLNLLIYNV